MATERFELDLDEVVVLNHVIHQLTERDDFATLIPDPADRQAIHNLLCLLEREDPSVFDAHYDQHLEQARERLLPDDN